MILFRSSTKTHSEALRGVLSEFTPTRVQQNGVNPLRTAYSSFNVTSWKLTRSELRLHGMPAKFYDRQ
uniref:Uncharacterized protein n=1 Tax=Enterobacter cloacae TaxID=550 RepID=A0A2L1K6J7_ENTCL|nr:Hypothetical protein [Enterobacter cloacae]URZ94221.1 Hypothetical protein [Raoultella ornithinolytica]UUC08540.1 hypothetical protein [Klebsiella pneumoniae]UUC08590.1 hypothetical protein [Serratia marcescens]